MEENVRRKGLSLVFRVRCQKELSVLFAGPSAYVYVLADTLQYMYLLKMESC